MIRKSLIALGAAAVLTTGMAATAEAHHKHNKFNIDVNFGGGYGGGYGGYGGYNGGYGGGYNSGGYGSPNLSFTCKVDYSGRVIDLKIEQLRRDYGYRGW